MNRHLGDRRVTLDVSVGKVHDWQRLEMLVDKQIKRESLRRETSNKRGFEANASVGKRVVGSVKGDQATLGLY